MATWLTVDWHTLFLPSRPVAETIIRGSCMYLAIFALLRGLRRQTGAVSPADLLVLLLIADAAQNGMTGDYKSITDGLVLIVTIIAWEYVLDWLGFHSRSMEKLLEHSPLLLIENGQILAGNLQHELMTHEDLMSRLRRKGIEKVADVKRCFLEGDGHVSVITYRDDDQTKDDQDDDDANGAH